MMRLFETLENAADGAFVIDESLRIVYWNKAAESILGFGSGDVTGQFCYQLLHGHNEGRRLICGARCQVAKLALLSKPVPNYDIHMKTKGGDTRWLNTSVFVYRTDDTDDKKTIVHLFHDNNHKEVDDKAIDQLIKVINRYHNIRHKNGNGLEIHHDTLTTREREILTLLADGHGTQDIAKLLSIRMNTVRNHIQYILEKFQVHTRLEAVTIAIKEDLIS